MRTFGKLVIRVCGILIIKLKICLTENPVAQLMLYEHYHLWYVYIVFTQVDGMINETFCECLFNNQYLSMLM